MNNKKEGSVKEIIELNGDSIAIDRELDLGYMQSIVGGYIEIVQVRDGKILVINEEGKILGLKPNQMATLLAKDSLQPGDYIAGRAIYCDAEFVK